MCHIASDFVTSASCVPDAKIDRPEDVFVEYPVRVISVAVLVAAV